MIAHSSLLSLSLAYHTKGLLDLLIMITCYYYTGGWEIMFQPTLTKFNFLVRASLLVLPRDAFTCFRCIKNLKLYQ